MKRSSYRAAKRTVRIDSIDGPTESHLPKTFFSQSPHLVNSDQFTAETARLLATLFPIVVRKAGNKRFHAIANFRVLAIARATLKPGERISVRIVEPNSDDDSESLVLDMLLSLVFSLHPKRAHPFGPILLEESTMFSPFMRRRLNKVQIARLLNTSVKTLFPPAPDTSSPAPAIGREDLEERCVPEEPKNDE